MTLLEAGLYLIVVQYLKTVMTYESQMETMEFLCSKKRIKISLYSFSEQVLFLFSFLILFEMEFNIYLILVIGSMHLLKIKKK